MIELGVNVDHVATVRQARRTYEPDPVWAAVEAHLGGADVKRRFDDNKTPHERAQTAADVRAEAVPAADEEVLPEALRRNPTPPLNKRTGRNPAR